MFLVIHLETMSSIKDYVLGRGSVYMFLEFFLYFHFYMYCHFHEYMSLHPFNRDRDRGR